MKRGQSTVGLVISAAGAIGVSVAFVLNYLNPQIQDVSQRQAQDHADIAAITEKVNSIDENVKLLISHQYWYNQPQQINNLNKSLP